MKIGNISITAKKLAGMIDYSSVFAPETTPEELKRACKQAIEYGFAAVSVHSQQVPLAYEILKGSKVKVDGAVG